MQFLKEGNERRSQEPTAANQTSSRSHALLQITLYRRSVQHGRLFLCDLAGSERAANSMVSRFLKYLLIAALLEPRQTTERGRGHQPLAARFRQRD